MSEFQQGKIWLMQLTGLPKDTLHVYVGLALFLLTAILLRRPLRSNLPIGVVILAALAGEAWDVLDTHMAGRTIRWAWNWHDLWNTCFWPTILFLLARFTRVLKK
jgi:cell shape-determining protein MreD